jgi:hypothetical protein
LRFPQSHWVNSPFVRYTDSVMAPKEIPPAQALGSIAQRIEKRKEILRRVSATGYNTAIAELDIVRGQILKAQAYFVSEYARPRCGPASNLAPSNRSARQIAEKDSR